LTKLFGALGTRFEPWQQLGGPALQSFSGYGSVIDGYCHITPPLPHIQTHILTSRLAWPGPAAWHTPVAVGASMPHLTAKRHTVIVGSRENIERIHA
jgi:hypothetical protein